MNYVTNTSGVMPAINEIFNFACFFAQIGVKIILAVNHCDFDCNQLVAATFFWSFSMSVWLSMSLAFNECGQRLFQTVCLQESSLYCRKMIVMNYRNYQNNSLSMESENWPIEQLLLFERANCFKLNLWRAFSMFIEFIFRIYSLAVFIEMYSLTLFSE